MPQTVAIVDLGSSNLRSAARAFDRAAADAGINASVLVTANPGDVVRADRVVLPGVGAFGAAMSAIVSVDGLLMALEHAVLASRRPFLGICVGMQLLADRGLEFGETAGLGWIAGDVVKLDAAARGVAVPQIGWNTIKPQTAYPLLPSLARPADYYFVHSFHFEAAHPEHVLAVANHGGPLSAAVGRDNILGVQFHPEKSQGAGLALLADFLQWRP